MEGEENSDVPPKLDDLEIKTVEPDNSNDDMLEELLKRRKELREVPEQDRNYLTNQQAIEIKKIEDSKKTNNPVTISLYKDESKIPKNSKKIRFCVISDTHNRHNHLNMSCSGDVLIHCGDFTDFQDWSNFSDKKEAWPESVFTFNKFLKFKLFKTCLVIAGNHDVGMEKYSKKVIKNALKNAIVLNDSSYLIDGQLKVYGTSWNSADKHMAFYTKNLAEKWRKIPRDTNILITHYPPVFQGDDSLKKEIQKLKHLKVHCYGHEHESYGWKMENGVMFINAASIKNKIHDKKKEKLEKKILDKNKKVELKSSASPMNSVILFDYYVKKNE